MSPLTRSEVVAMWLWDTEYAASGMSAIDWHKALDAGRRRLVADFVREYESARQREWSKKAKAGGAP